MVNLPLPCEADHDSTTAASIFQQAGTVSNASSASVHYYTDTETLCNRRNASPRSRRSSSPHRRDSLHIQKGTRTGRRGPDRVHLRHRAWQCIPVLPCSGWSSWLRTSIPNRLLHRCCFIYRFGASRCRRSCFHRPAKLLHRAIASETPSETPSGIILTQGTTANQC